MAEFNLRSDSVNVEQIMEQIRARIREKRGVDYTEQQIRELAAVKLEKFLDPRGIRSDLLEQFRKRQPRYEPPLVPTFTFEDTTLFETHRGLLRFIRNLLKPLLKLFFNPNALAHALHTQAEINRVNLDREVSRENQRRDVDALYFEVIHNLVLEVTRNGIELKNLKMRVESLSSRLEFNERRARALESVVVYKPQGERSEWPAPRPAAAPGAPAGPAAPPAAVPGPPAPAGGAPTAPEGLGQRSRRRRRRRGRRGGAPAAAVMGMPSAEPGAPVETQPHAGGANDEAAREAGETHDAAAEGLEQAMGADSHGSEPGNEGGGGFDPDTP